MISLLISSWKPMLWVLIRIASARSFMKIWQKLSLNYHQISSNKHLIIQNAELEAFVSRLITDLNYYEGNWSLTRHRLTCNSDWLLTNYNLVGDWLLHGRLTTTDWLSSQKGVPFMWLGFLKWLKQAQWLPVSCNEVSHQLVATQSQGLCDQGCTESRFENISM